LTPLPELTANPEEQKLIDEYNQRLESIPLSVREKLGAAKMTIR